MGCSMSHQSNKHKQTNATNMPKETNIKFTAAMTFNSDKEVIQNWRDRCGLGEKEMMRVLLRVADDNADAVVAKAEAYKVEVQAEAQAAKEAAKAEKAQAKAKAKAERDAKRAEVKAEKAAAKAAAKAEREQKRAEAKAAKEAAKAAEAPAELVEA